MEIASTIVHGLSQNRLVKYTMNGKDRRRLLHQLHTLLAQKIQHEGQPRQVYHPYLVRTSVSVEAYPRTHTHTHTHTLKVTNFPPMYGAQVQSRTRNEETTFSHKRRIHLSNLAALTVSYCQTVCPGMSQSQVNEIVAFVRGAFEKDGPGCLYYDLVALEDRAQWQTLSSTAGSRKRLADDIDCRDTDSHDDADDDDTTVLPPRTKVQRTDSHVLGKQEEEEKPTTTTTTTTTSCSTSSSNGSGIAFIDLTGELEFPLYIHQNTRPAEHHTSTTDVEVIDLTNDD